MPGALSQLTTQVPFNQVAHVSGGQTRAQQRLQLAERGFTGHAAARQHASPAQAATGFVHVQLHSAFVALGDGDHDDAVFVRLLQACEERRVVAGAGAAAETLQHQSFNPAVEHGIQLGGTKAESLPAALSYQQPKQEARVGALPLVPGIGAAQLDAVLNSGIEALVLECFGSGTGPGDNPAFLASLQQAYESGIAVVAITQCHEGGVELDVYEAGSRLRGAGVLSGGGMTREAAFGKLHALLGSGLPTADVRRLVELDLCGELA